MATVGLILGERRAQADLTEPREIGITPRTQGNLTCFGAPELSVTPFRAGQFVGDTREGSPVNFMDLRCNPHANGTHTECVGHITQERIGLAECHRDYHFPALLHTLAPERQSDGDFQIGLSQLATIPEIPEGLRGIILRTLPNPPEKRYRQYTGTNPPYFTAGAMEWLVEKGIDHLLTDLPSVDREVDGGKLIAHRTFWQYPAATRMQATITELIYVPDSVVDGFYLVNLQYFPFPMDAAPSRPVLYALQF